MKTQNFCKRIAIALAPLAVLLLIDLVPVSRAANVIPESGSQVALADTTPPSDVENLKASAGDSSVTLTWNVATDNIGVKGYRVYYGPKSVTIDGGNYANGPVDAGNKINYTASGLTNGTKYYFAVTAYDAAGNESVNYSVEASATPLHGSADTQAPKVSKAEAVDKAHVKVTFSEAVALPATTPESAFSIKNDTTGVQLNVQSAAMDQTDPSGKSVLLTTVNQQAGASYILTAGIGIKDLAGNPIVSGTSDTAAFTGTDLVPVVQTQQVANGPQLVSVQVSDSSHVTVTFSEPVVLKADKRENFIITEEQNIENTLDIQAVNVNSTGDKVTLTTDPMKALSYNLIAVDVSDAGGNEMSVENNATTFMGVAASAAATQQQVIQPASTQQGLLSDTTPPEDATDFTAAMVKKLIVTLNWTKSLNSAGDLAQYMLYMSTDGTTYGKGIDVGPTSKNFDVTNIVPGIKYFFRLTAKDKTGNESRGVETTFILPKTGPELGLVLLGSLGLGKLMKRRKKTGKHSARKN
jgi:hypothetical protein